MKRKTLNFAFFKLCWEDQSGKISDFDLVEWMSGIESKKGLNLSWPVGEIGSILLSRSECRNDRFYLYTLYKLRYGTPPCTFKENEEPKSIHLSKNEEFVEPTYILYDKTLKVAMIQSVKTSLSFSNLIKWINWQTNNDPDFARKGRFSLSEIYSDDVFEKLEKSQIRSLDLRLEFDPHSSKVHGDDTLTSSIRAISSSSGANTISMKLSVKRGNSNHLDKISTSKLIKNFISDYENGDETQKKLIAKLVDSTGNISDINLLDNSLRSSIVFRLERKETLDPSKVFASMLDEYKSKKNEIERLIDFH